MAFDDETIPYPIAPLRGWLLLAGMSRLDCENTIHRVLTQSEGKTFTTEKQLMEELAEDAFVVDSQAIDSLSLLFRYENLRRQGKVSSITMLIEGTSATGKSIIAITAIELLAVTRIISTDTIRQLLRARSDEAIHPELYTHTYQAHKFAKKGPSVLSDIVRGYLAQCAHMREDISSTIRRIVSEGIHSVVEGVHIEPGQHSNLSEGILEVLVDPSERTHRSMFLTKLSATGLRTVQDTTQQRIDEFKATREIQHYLKARGEDHGVEILSLGDYHSASCQLAEIVMEKIESLLQTAENK